MAGEDEGGGGEEEESRGLRCFMGGLRAGLKALNQKSGELARGKRQGVKKSAFEVRSPP